jgi:hypothetical protein
VVVGNAACGTCGEVLPLAVMEVSEFGYRCDPCGDLENPDQVPDALRATWPGGMAASGLHLVIAGFTLVAAASVDPSAPVVVGALLSMLLGPFFVVGATVHAAIQLRQERRQARALLGAGLDAGRAGGITRALNACQAASGALALVGILLVWGRVIAG